MLSSPPFLIFCQEICTHPHCLLSTCCCFCARLRLDSSPGPEHCWSPCNACAAGLGAGQLNTPGRKESVAGLLLLPNFTGNMLILLASSTSCSVSPLVLTLMGSWGGICYCTENQRVVSWIGCSYRIFTWRRWEPSHTSARYWPMSTWNMGL